VWYKQVKIQNEQHFGDIVTPFLNSSAKKRIAKKIRQDKRIP